MKAQALVSCIMPTYNRRRFVAQAIWYFLRQDYPERELLILDDGEDAVADLVPEDPRIRYVRLSERRSLGAKRNLACELSRGELICHWDDDDWMASNRLSRQIAALEASAADVCGVRDLLHYRPQFGDAWLYSYPPGARPWLAGGTLVYRRAVWQERPFPDLQVGEDTAFIWQHPPARLHAMADHSFYLALIHGRNTAVKNVGDPRWQRRPLDEVGRLLVHDREFYASLRRGGLAAPVGLRHTPDRVTLAASFLTYDGYGSMSEYLALGMARAGVTVDIVPLTFDPAGLSEEFHALLRGARPAAGAPVLFFSWPNAAFQRYSGARDLFINTMWEASRLPAGWAASLNKARVVIVPTRFCAEVCRQSGVTAPVVVVPEGVDPAIYHYVERSEGSGLTTLMVGTMVERKHMREGIAAWEQAFAGDPEARLLIKARYNYNNFRSDDPRITVVDANESTRGIAHWYRQADVLMALGNEGFGLPLVEAMACGLPVIALSSEGQSDVCEEAGELLLPVPPGSWQPCNDPPFGPAGVRGVPDIGVVAARLRWVTTHRAEAQAMGRAASAWALRHRNIWDKAPAVVAAMEQHLANPRPLRRSRVLWVPTWGRPCGVAEYTRHLLAHLPGIVTATAPDPRATRLLHIQHEPSLFNNQDLTSTIQMASRRGAAVVVTEHAVTAVAQAWEREADALVVPTPRARETLRARWPGQRVELIPLGCPTWFPPRKAGRGRVIGLFGFLEHHKGCWQVLDALRALPGAELVMYCHAKRQTVEQEWEAAAAGLPVRWVREFLPIDVVAEHLAREADILVFWYKETQVLSASSAVRVGMATGVPVLTSRTEWFRDVSVATYQPEDLSAGIERLMEDELLRDELVGAAREYCHQHSWQTIGERHLALWQSLERA